MALIDVPSEKNPEVVYQVDTETGECSCPQYQKRLKALNAENAPEFWKYCKHYDQAISIEYPSTDQA